MLAIGRALMSRPRLLLLDEPSMGLAPIVVQKIFEVVRDINKAGVTVLLVEQNANLALQVATRAYVLESGLITLSPTEPFFTTLKVCFWAAILASLPVWLYQAYAFVIPAVQDQSRRRMLLIEITAYRK